MTLKKEINEIKARLIKVQNEITRLAIFGYEVGDQEVDRRNLKRKIIAN